MKNQKLKRSVLLQTGRTAIAYTYPAIFVWVDEENLCSGYIPDLAIYAKCKSLEES
ncbi:MAG: hypothetical protein FWC10_00755 [Lentimicrobiaceae bacterium]|nr:hypothetical protein [Lentimicrobiaceae bacterium]